MEPDLQGWRPLRDHGSRPACHFEPQRIEVRPSTETPSPDQPFEMTPDEADARQFDERLTRGIKEGSFYTLLVSPRHYDRACQELARRFPVDLVSFEGLFLEKLREVVDKAGARWDAVVSADATRGDARWDKFMVLVKRTIPLVEQQLSQAHGRRCVIYAGLLARYSQMDLLERLRDQIGRRDGIPSLWLLVPGDHQPLDGRHSHPPLEPRPAHAHPGTVAKKSEPRITRIARIRKPKSVQTRVIPDAVQTETLQHQFGLLAQPGHDSVLAPSPVGRGLG